MFLNTIIQGHVLKILREFSDNSIDMVVTSPPYYKMRSYDVTPQIFGGDINCHHEWSVISVEKGTSGGTKSRKVQIKGKDNFQITKDTYHQTCLICGAWLGELGQEPTAKLFVEHLGEIFLECARVMKPSGTMWINIADKRSQNKKDACIQSLIGIPDRLKIFMIDNGLICFNEIIWHKPNQFPQPHKTRFKIGRAHV